MNFQANPQLILQFITHISCSFLIRVHQVINGVKDLDVYIEQPCETYEECLSVRQHCPLPMVLDECMNDIGEEAIICTLCACCNHAILISRVSCEFDVFALSGVLVKIISDRAADVINLKISKVLLTLLLLLLGLV